VANYRNRALLNKAHEVNQCQFMLPGVCERYSPGGCEPAHSNNIRDGKGTGIKSHDYMHVAACRTCHLEYDSGSKFTKEEKQDYFERGWVRTFRYYLYHNMVGPK